MNWNDTLLQANTGELFVCNNNLASYDLHFVKSSNVDLIAVSYHLKEMLVRFKNGNKYIYKDVTPEVMKAILSPELESIGGYLNSYVKGHFRYEQIYWAINPASMTDVVKNFRNMQYTITINSGCMVTDRADIVKEYAGGQLMLDKYFWKFEFTEQPENAQRIK